MKNKNEKSAGVRDATDAFDFAVWFKLGKGAFEGFAVPVLAV